MLIDQLYRKMSWMTKTREKTNIHINIQILSSAKSLTLCTIYTHYFTVTNCDQPDLIIFKNWKLFLATYNLHSLLNHHFYADDTHLYITLTPTNFSRSIQKLNKRVRGAPKGGLRTQETRLATALIKFRNKERNIRLPT